MTEPRERILIVDDSETNLLVCQRILENNYEVHTVMSAAEMFTLLETVTPDIILLDIEMPKMNGYEAARILKTRDEMKDIPILFFTSLSETRYEMKGMELGAVDYISKQPFVAARFYQRVKTHLAHAAERKRMRKENETIRIELAGVKAELASVKVELEGVKRDAANDPKATGGGEAHVESKGDTGCLA